MLIDTHAHLNFNAFKQDSEKIIDGCLKENTWMINVGSQFSTSKRAVHIAENYKQGVYASVGLHPIHLSVLEIDEAETGKLITAAEKFDYQKYKELAGSSKVVAIGEIGLDYFHINPDDEENKNRQKQTFKKQLALAEELKLPVILHCRNAYDEMLKILQSTANRQSTDNGVIHCFGGTLKQAQEFIRLGFCIGFTGIITFGKKAEDLVKVVSLIPMEKILVETDCPYLAPEPFRGQRNMPLYVKYVAEKVAKIKGIEYNKVVEKTSENAINLFNLH
ncbi:TatD family deoxyribonuclease [Candidatus Parcubacteria bacterium]|nr:MAG: TatD family deoxyribonuclease [Candidatus Parcubacteria bacterium]